MRCGIRLVCILALAGHLCLAPEPGHAGAPAPTAGVAIHQACDSMPPAVAPAGDGPPPAAQAVASTSPPLAPDVGAPGGAPQPPAPVPRRPRFLLHASLRN